MINPPFFRKESWPYFLGFFLLMIVLYLPSVWVGFLLDDYLILEKIQTTHSSVFQIMLDSYRWIDPAHVSQAIADGTLPWWSNPHLSILFFRPLTALSFLIDHALFQKNAIGYHLDSLCWWFMGVLIWSQVLKSSFTIKQAQIYWFSLFLLICSQVYVLPVLWIAHRHALLALVFTFSSLYAYQRKSLFLSLFLFCCALLSSEWSFGGAVYLCLFIFFFETTLRKKIMSALPFLGLMLLYLIAYHFLGFGTRGSALYLNPFEHPLHYLYLLGRRLPDLLLMIFTGQNEAADLFAHYDMVWLIKVAVLSIISAIFIGCIQTYPATVKRTLYWLAASTFLSCLPFTTSIPQVRLLVFPMLGGSVITAAILYWPWHHPDQQRFLKMIFKIAVIVYLIQRFLLTPINILFNTYGYFIVNQQLIADAKHRVFSKNEITPVAPYAQSPFWINSIRRFYGLPAITPWYLLLMSPETSLLQTLSPHQITLKNPNGLFDDPHAFIFRDTPFHLNETFKTPRFTAKITGVREGMPTEIIYTQIAHTSI